jgi:hypothetical protein
MHLSLLRLLLPLATVALLAPASAFAQKSSATSSGPTVIPGGSVATPYVIDKAGSYLLGGDRVMTDTTKNAIEITAADVTLDLGGYKIGFSALTGTGNIINVPTAVNVEVRNGSLAQAPGYAVFSTQTTGDVLRLIDLRIADCRGILSKAAGTLVERCNLSDIGSNGIDAQGYAAVVRNCLVRNAGYHAIAVGAGALVTGNQVNGAVCAGIAVYSTVNVSNAGARIENNTIYNANTVATSNYAGINSYVTGVTVKNNAIIRARCNGISASGGCILADNTISDTQPAFNDQSRNGIISLSATNVVRNNTGTNNGTFIIGPYTDAGGNVGN